MIGLVPPPLVLRVVVPVPSLTLMLGGMANSVSGSGCALAMVMFCVTCGAAP
jgi:hypothetical protein